MKQPERPLRRCALLIFPGVSLNVLSLDRIAREGFTDVGVTILGTASQENFKGQGFSLAEGQKLSQLAEERGLGLICFSGYMKYQEPLIAREPGRAMILRGGGDSLDSDGLPSNWLCPFRAENKAMYLELLQEIIRWRALREVHLNDEAMLGFGPQRLGCYCDHCCREFSKRSGSPPPPRADWNNPLWWDWIDFRMESWTEVHAEFRDAIKRVRPEVAVGIQHNSLPATFTKTPWVMGFSLARDARSLDLLATDPYHFIHDRTIPFRPQRRILGEATRILVGACTDRQVNLYPQAFMPPGTSAPLGRQDGLLAGIVPFALGADTITPYAYELMQIIPGFVEGLQDAERLENELANASPYSFATVLFPLQSEIRGHPMADWGKNYLIPLSDLMIRTGTPWRWAWDERLEDERVTLAGPLVIPEAHCLTEAQRSVIREIANRGQGIVWIGNSAQENWRGTGESPLPSPFEMGVFELSLSDPHPLLEGLTRPVYLSSRVRWEGPAGKVLGTVDGKPGLVLVENAGRREAWLSGLPAHTFVPKESYGTRRVPTGGVDLLRRLLCWAAGRQPLVRLDPSPPPNAYAKLRPWDKRDIPTMELLPLVSADFVLAIVFLYAPVAFETSLKICLPPKAALHSARDVWSDRDLADDVTRSADGTTLEIPLRVAGDTELLAIRVDYSGSLTTSATS